MKAFERLKKARVQLQKDFPFFAYLCLYIKFGEEETKGVNTIGIDGNGNMYYNEDWISGLDDEELKSVNCHEALHLAFLHMVRRGTRHPEIWNLADDLAINCILVANKFKLPDGIVPDEEGNFDLCLRDKQLNNRRLGALAGMNPYDDVFKENAIDERREGE